MALMILPYWLSMCKKKGHKITEIANTPLDILSPVCYYESTRQANRFTKGSEDMSEMTTAELNQYLENIAKLIEANAESVEAAAQIIRDSKVTA